jgi:hypothetical protein
MRIACCVVFASAVSAACVAPPLGIGTGAHGHVASGNGMAASAGVGVAADREVVQVDASFAHRYTKRFALEVGGAMTQLGVQRATDRLIGVGILPYVRPRWTLGRASVALAGSAFAAAGGETGAVGAFLDLQVGIGGDRWSIYAGAYGLGYLEGLGPSVAATQARIGAELFVGRIGIALELFSGLDALRATDDPMATSSRFLGAGVKLRWESR